MAFLDETGLNYFKRKNDATYAFKAHTHNYAGSSSAGGPATSANKLNTNAGNATTPVYFSNGIPVACTSYSSASVWHATKATNDDGGRRIDTTYLKSVTSDGQSLSLVKGDGTSSTTYINKQIILRSNSNTDKGKYLKFATIDLSSDSAWGYCLGTLSFGMAEGASVLGLLKFEFRNGSTAGVLGVGNLTWISINDIDYVSNVVAVKNSSNAYELYYKPVRDWESPSVTLLDITGTEHFQFGLGTFVDSVTPVYTSTLASCATTANSATSATYAMYIDQNAVTSADYTNWRSLIWGSPNSPTEGFTPSSTAGQLYVANTLSCQPSSGTIKATTFKGSLSGNASTATTASKLSTNAGGATTPVYFSNGIPVACTPYSNASVKYATSAGSASTATTADRVANTGSGSADVARHVWFSDSSIETARVSNDNFKYNPSGNLLTANISGNAATASSVAWGNVSGKPSFSTVATSGSYNDLSNKPTIPSVGNGTVTITQNGVSKGSFTLNQSGNATIALTDTDTNTTYSAISSTDIKALFA